MNEETHVYKKCNNHNKHNHLTLPECTGTEVFESETTNKELEILTQFPNIEQ